MSQPIVTIICLCYNHERFVQEALESVWKQSYPSIQLIIVDDASSDGSVGVIKKLIVNKPDVIFLEQRENQGSCRSFNRALKLAQGELFIDLAADDVLLPERVTTGVDMFQDLGHTYGLQFSDAEIIDENGKHLRYHSGKFPHACIPQGDIYKDLIDRYFICSPTMMFTRKVMEHNQGYDESLAFEDFDLWMRASRDFKFCYSPQVLVKRRVVKTSMSKNQFTKNNSQRWSTLKVCEKIKHLNRTQEEDKALRHRLTYEFLLSLKMIDIKLAFGFLKLWWR